MEDLERLKKSIVDIALESWRFKGTFQKMLTKLDERNAARLNNSYTYFERKVTAAANEAGIHIIDLTGEDFDVGMAVSALNIDEFPDDSDLIITNTVEPVIMEGTKVLRNGTVMVGRKEK